MTAPVKVASGKNFIVYKIGEEKAILIQNVRASYPAFGEQKVNENDNGSETRQWGGVAMLSKKTHKEAKEAYMAICKEIMEANKVKIPSEYLAIKDGDEKEDENVHGHWLIAFSDKGKRRPPARDKSGQVIETAEEVDEMFYGGCWMNVFLRPWFFNGKAKGSAKTYPKRIPCGYIGVQFVKDDTPFGSGRVDDTEVWGSVASDDDEDGDDGI